MSLSRRDALTLSAAGLVMPRQTAPRWAEAATSAGSDNLFPNSQWQILTALGPGWNGDPATLQGHLDSFDTEWNWLGAGNLPGIVVDRIELAPERPGGQVEVRVFGDDAVQHLYPGAILTFDAAAPAELRVSPVRVRSVDYGRRSFTLLPPRNPSLRIGRIRCACRQVMRADMKGVTGHGPDGWSKTMSAHLWIDRWPRLVDAARLGMTFDANAKAPLRPAWRSNLRPSMKRCVVFVPQGAADAYFYHAPADFETLRGRRVVFGMWVQRVSGGRGRLFVNDGAVSKSRSVAAGADWTWLEMSHVVAADAQGVAFGFVAEDSDRSAWRIAEPMLTFGAELGEGAYVRPKGRVEQFVVKMTPDSYYGADFAFRTGGAVVDFAGETGLAIAEDVPVVFGELEGSPGRAGLPLFTRSQYEPPHRYGAAIHAPVAGRAAAGWAMFDINADGTLWLFSEPGARWRDVSFDLNQAVLW